MPCTCLGPLQEYIQYSSHHHKRWMLSHKTQVIGMHSTTIDAWCCCTTT